MYKGSPNRITADFSVEILKAKRAWIYIFQTLRDHGCPPRLLYLAKISITIKRDKKIFYDKVKFSIYTQTQIYRGQYFKPMKLFTTRKTQEIDNTKSEKNIPYRQTDTCTYTLTQS